MDNQNDIDQLFRQGLNEPEIPFNELDWEKMERKLDAAKPKKLIPLWAYTVTGIAAALVILLTWILLSPPSVKKSIDNQPFTEIQSKNRPEKQHFLQAKESEGNHQELAARIFKPLAPVDSIEVPEIAKVVFPVTKENMVQVVPSKESDSAALSRKANALANSKDVFGRSDQKDLERSVRKKMEDVLARQQHNLILSAMAAPDISTVKSSKPAKISTNLGMTATYALTQKFSVTSGAVYSKKYYNYGNSGDNPSGYPWEVDADCDVLDIPLNVNYKLMKKKNLSVSVNTGLSSYFMLKEKYQYTTGEPGAEKITNIVIDNQNQHIFGVANVSVSFDHQISDQISVGVQPFAKLPLTGIGNNNANLKSAGISFSLNIGLFPSKKPGKYAAVRYSSLR